MERTKSNVKLTSNPLSVDVLPSVAANLFELEQDGIKGAGIEPRDAHLDHGEHPAAVLGHDHLVCKLFELFPQLKLLKVKLSFHEQGLDGAGNINCQSLPQVGWRLSDEEERVQRRPFAFRPSYQLDLVA